jgi:hypothetical protein
MGRVFLAGAAALALTGCATITRGTTEQLQIQSTPTEARATTSLGQSCVTPCTIQVSRKDEFTVSFQKDGYEPQQVEVKTQIAGTGAAGFAGNVLFGGIVGMGADVATGATLNHVPNPVRVDLLPLPQPVPPVVRQQPRHRRSPKTTS